MSGKAYSNDEVYPDPEDLSIITALASKRAPVPPHVNINCIGTAKSNEERKVRYTLRVLSISVMFGRMRIATLIKVFRCSVCG